jgi:uncharacterized membrane protein
MKELLISWLTVAGDALQNNSRFMTWNLFLALVPLGLSFWLFYQPRSLWLRWGVPLLIGATFLPNSLRVAEYALYLLRDLGTNYLLWTALFTTVLMALEIGRLQRGQGRSHVLFWWIGFATFIAFLPNAPYVLTDVIHLIEDIRQGYSVWIITLALIPQYLVFMILGFEAYVLSLMNLGRYLKRNGWGNWIAIAEIIIHGLSAIGIYIGRFQRFNSWDIVTNPDVLVTRVMTELVGKRPVLVMVVTFVVITILYWICKKLTLGIVSLQALEASKNTVAPLYKPQESE